MSCYHGWKGDSNLMLMSLSIDCVSCEKGTKDVSSLFCGREMPCILDRWRVIRTGTLIRMRKKKKQSQSSQLDPSNPIERSVTSLIFLEKINQVHQLLFFWESSAFIYSVEGAWLTKPLVKSGLAHLYQPDIQILTFSNNWNIEYKHICSKKKSGQRKVQFGPGNRPRGADT